MAVINKRANEGTVLTASAATQYTAPALTKAVIKKWTLCNTSAAAVTVTLYLILSGGTAGASNTLWSAKTIPAGATVEVFEAEGHVLEAGDFIQALCSAITSVTSAISVLEVTP